MLHKLARTTDIMVQTYVVRYHEVILTPPTTVCPWSVSNQATGLF